MRRRQPRFVWQAIFRLATGAPRSGWHCYERTGPAPWSALCSSTSRFQDEEGWHPGLGVVRHALEPAEPCPTCSARLSVLARLEAA